MNLYKSLKGITLLSSLCIAFGITACGDDSSSSPDSPSIKSSTSTDTGDDIDDPDEPSESSSSKANSTSEETSSNPQPQSSASETTSSNEALNAESNKVTGTCAPEGDISKGELATWTFFRNEETSVFDQIMAPFVWTFEGASQKTVQGNGMQSVNLRYETAGSYKASLTVDGNKIECEELLVQGIPITVESCKPSKASAYIGEKITWTVTATSESKITSYSWSSTNGSVSGTGVEGTMTAPEGLHKQPIAPTVTISNEDNSVVKYACENATILDPNHVDIILGLGDVNQLPVEQGNIAGVPDSAFIPAGTPTIIQIPSNAPSSCSFACKPKIGSESDLLKMTLDGSEITNKGYITNGCVPNKTYSITATVTAICSVNKQ